MAAVNIETISTRMSRSGGYTTGFDYIRICLATAVLIAHSVPVTRGRQLEDVAWPFVLFYQNLLPMFFALGGFLVTGSLVRTSLPGFIALRALRIFPALTAEVVLSALILGPLVTTVSLSQYFSDEKLYLYFYNVLGNIHLELPGVFASLPYPNITNGSLWTVPFELMSYVILIGLALTSIARSWRLTLGVFVLGSGYLAYALIVRAEFVIPRVLVLDFFAGVCLFLMRDFVPLRLVFFVLSLIVLFSIMKIPALLPISPMFVAYVTVYIGLLNIPNNPVLRSGDYSYGIYLYAFPIQQTLVYAFPMFENRWYYHALASFVVVLIFAVFSWHCIERPAMGLKRFLKDGRLDKRDAMLLHLATERPERQGKK